MRAVQRLRWVEFSVWVAGLSARESESGSHVRGNKMRNRLYRRCSGVWVAPEISRLRASWDWRRGGDQESEKPVKIAGCREREWSAWWVLGIVAPFGEASVPVIQPTKCVCVPTIATRERERESE